MPNWIKISIKILGIFAILIVLLWLGAAIYINVNKKALLKQITTQLSENINGTLTIEDMEPSLIRGFPGISVSLKNVLLRDSLYAVHHHDLLQANDIYISMNVLSLLSGTPAIRNMHINTGKIYLFTDSMGYSNARIFRKKNDTATHTHRERPHVNHIFLENVDFTFENNNKLKLFKVDIHDLETLIDYNDSGWAAKANLRAFVKSFAFNTTRGSFLKDKALGMDITLRYNNATNVLSIADQLINIGSDAVSVGGKFSFAEVPATYMLNIGAKDIQFKNAIALLSPNISSRFAVIDLQKPLDISAGLSGAMKFRDTPLVYVAWVVKNNVLVSPAGEIKNCSFSGQFTNQQVSYGGHNDRNSIISLYGMKGSWQDIPFNADTVRVSNLITPVIEGRFQSRFSLALLNPIIGGNTFSFDNGNLNLNLLYRGGLLADDSTTSYIFGTVAVSNAALTYLPRNLSFVNTGARLNFRGSDVFIDQVTVQSGASVLEMNGSMRNFLNLYYSDPAKILLDWHIRSPKIDLNEFRSFLAPRASKKVISAESKSIAKTAHVTRIAQQLDKMLADCSVRMQLQLDKLLYRKFTANNVNADIQLDQGAVVLNNISLSHAGGKLALHGSLDQKGSVNAFHVVTDVDHVNVQEFFQSFENFGQDAITDKNLRGILYAHVDMTGNIREDGKILPGSFNGTVHFDVRDGALVNFEPFRKVSKYVFRNRNLENVTFNNLKNDLDIKGDKIKINPMVIASSAFNVQVRGIYALSSGTDIDIDVPLRNPKKDELALEDNPDLRGNLKGIVIHLKAVDGDDGNVKIKLMGRRQDAKTDETDKTRPQEKTKRRKLFSK